MTGFDEMHDAAGAVRAHYRTYQQWLDQQPMEVMQAQRQGPS
jgi:uncharacterized circularly permuted ATP-grasp superfamily protein